MVLCGAHPVLLRRVSDILRYFAPRQSFQASFVEDKALPKRPPEALPMLILSSEVDDGLFIETRDETRVVRGVYS